ncbi:MAG: tetratricopeptide repeat protein [candidate division NC10 bacterium]|nr:tetratricopeptide repeat protein [candidate division NC10 bacterium]
MRTLSLIFIALWVSMLGVPAVHAASDEAVQRNNLGASLLQQGKMEEAIAEFRKAVTLDPKYTGAQLNLAYAYDRQGRIAEALAQYQTVIALEPENLFAQNNLGVLYDKQGRYDEAIAAFEQVLQIDPSNATALRNLENAKRNNGIVQEQEERFAQAQKEVEARPDDPRAAYNLGRLHASFDEKDQALEWIAKALELGFDDFKFLKDDPALASLRDDPRFTGLLEGR